MDKNTLISSFGKWVAPICMKKLQEKVEETEQDKYVKKLTTKAYLLLFLHAQLHQRQGLREIADDVLHEDFQRELGLESISAAQLPRKHNRVDSVLLEDIFMHVVHQIYHFSSLIPNRRDYKIIDSTTISLCLQKYPWATFRKTKAGMKLHHRLVFVSPDDVCPEKVVMTPAKSSDRSQMEELIDEKGMTYVFDRGYNDYAKYDEYTDQGIFFVTRLKKNAVVRIVCSFSLPEDSRVQSDEMVSIGTPQKRMENVLRLIKVIDSRGKQIEILTNRFDLSADEISDMYRHRWAIETFFKWMKQHVQIQSFYGTSEQAVMNQVYMALIAFCLLVLMKLESRVDHSLLQIQRWLKVLLWKTADQWIFRIHHRPKRTSKGRQRW
jgi:hypothetical protein